MACRTTGDATSAALPRRTADGVGRRRAGIAALHGSFLWRVALGGGLGDAGGVSAPDGGRRRHAQYRRRDGHRQRDGGEVGTSVGDGLTTHGAELGAGP